MVIMEYKYMRIYFCDVKLRQNQSPRLIQNIKILNLLK